MTDIIAPPSVRALAREKGINLEELARNLGRTNIVREDLDNTSPTAANSNTSDTSLWDVDHSRHGKVREEPMSRFAQVAASNLAAAQTHIPAVTHHERADISAVEAWRRKLKPEAQARGVKLTALAFHVVALARCLQEFPRFNASLSADGQTLVLKEYVHIGIAVDTAHGLMVPVIRNAETKGLWQIGAEIADLAARAQNRKIAADEMGGASMTITNLGGIGGIGFTPIVNPPEVAILGLTRPESIPVWDGDAFQPVPMVSVDLSYDHRVINGADAARFSARYSSLLSDPRRMMV
ncbi:2-oxo acid dehydrogenase subunit E2 [Marinobacter sp. HL-58]|uniref:2-oxo acid dehydrogenase subunit E2 n=1 Tax=Marinobacter sp. HL-58 TaxID=1479237 RepID=UPI000691A8EB|nr:2-oxo acid dehydrogenase subunit E2 [Marinobacter sp. HL-58]KPP99365.1 MAG: pyruvate dehydrogenase E2 component (dihydrolipoamide acetyltransferase) [Marinobacter sp. HL-58]